MMSFWLDIRYGLRVLGEESRIHGNCHSDARLGIGANTALFSVVNGVAFSIRCLSQSKRTRRGLLKVLDVFRKAPSLYPNFLDWQKTITLSRP